VSDSDNVRPRGFGANSEKDDIAMRMPWNFLRSRNSRNTSQEYDVEKLPASSVINLKIRVADSADLPPVSPSRIEAADPEKLRTELEAGTETFDATVSRDGIAVVDAQVLEEKIVSTKLDARHLSGADKGEVQRSSNDVTASKSASADFADERHADKVAMGAEPVEIQVVPTPREKPLQSIAVRQTPDVKPPIIDLPSTRNHDARGDMAELDSEIAELRRTLSSKLSVQNEQLRQLLQRFPD
jgi:hypothetical protein